MNFFNYFLRYSLTRYLFRYLKPKYIIPILALGIILFFVFNNYSEASSDSIIYEHWDNKAFSNSDSGSSTNVVSYSGLKGFAVYIEPMTKGDLQLNIITNELHIAYFYNVNIPKVGDTLSPYWHYSYNKNNNTLSFDATSGSARSTGYWIVYYAVDITSSETPYYDYFVDESDAGLINSALQQQTNTITNAINDLNDSITSQNDYIQSNPDSSDFNSSDLPSNSGVGSDITVEGFNTIFTSIYNAMTRNPSSSDNITIAIPFTSKSFVIPYNYTSTYCPSYLKNLISLFWYFVISLYIVKDIADKFNKLRSGDVENLQNTNIKGDLL